MANELAPINKEYKKFKKEKKINWTKKENERNQALAVEIWHYFGEQDSRQRLGIPRLKKEINVRGYQAVKETWEQFLKQHRAKGVAYFEAMLAGQTVTWIQGSNYNVGIPHKPNQ